MARCVRECCDRPCRRGIVTGKVDSTWRHIRDLRPAVRPGGRGACSPREGERMAITMSLLPQREGDDQVLRFGPHQRALLEDGCTRQ